MLLTQRIPMLRGTSHMSIPTSRNATKTGPPPAATLMIIAMATAAMRHEASLTTETCDACMVMMVMAGTW